MIGIPRAALFAGLVVVAGPASAAEGDPANGQAAFNTHCRTCHLAHRPENRVGPHLVGVVGRKAGTVEGFAYSQSLEGSGIVWNETTLDQYIADPAAVASGTSMMVQLADEQARADIIAYLEQQTE